MKRLLSSAAVLAALSATPALADAELYMLDASHSQIVFSWNHLGLSTTYGMFSGFEGEIMFDADAPENSSVSVAMPTTSMFTGWEARTAHMLGDDFFSAAEGDMISFASTGIEVTGDDTALITGDLTIGGETVEVVLDAVLNSAGPSPLPQMNGALVAGFDATTTLSRTEFGLGAFTPFVGDEVTVQISIESIRAEDMEG
jgi:polyisoprenoid-binding protein YceI